jgi:hypothetical protein
VAESGGGGGGGGAATAKAMGKLGNIVVETFVILDVSSNVSLFAHP